MQLVAEPQTPNAIRFVYDKPRSGLQPLGIRSGMLLFNGLRDGDTVTGQAVTYSRRCAPMEFAVTGRIVNETRVVLQGLKPNRNSACEVIGNVTDTLEFDLVQRR